MTPSWADSAHRLCARSCLVPATEAAFVLLLIEQTPPQKQFLTYDEADGGGLICDFGSVPAQPPVMPQLHKYHIRRSPSLSANARLSPCMWLESCSITIRQERSSRVALSSLFGTLVLTTNFIRGVFPRR